MLVHSDSQDIPSLPSPKVTTHNSHYVLENVPLKLIKLPLLHHMEHAGHHPSLNQLKNPDRPTALFLKISFSL